MAHTWALSKELGLCLGKTELLQVTGDSGVTEGAIHWNGRRVISAGPLYPSELCRWHGQIELESVPRSRAGIGSWSALDA